jgi:hypothetical protein
VNFKALKEEDDPFDVDCQLAELVDILIPKGHSQSTSPPPASTAAAIRDLFKHCVPEQYPIDQSEKFLQPADMVPTLLPFQRRAVGWMLWREGSPLLNRSTNALANCPAVPLFYEKRVNDCGDDVFINVLSGRVFASVRSIHDLSNLETMKGGILADEMGLGKTLEVLALILLNRAPESYSSVRKVARLEDKEDEEKNDAGSKTGNSSANSLKCPLCLFSTNAHNPIGTLIVQCGGCQVFFHGQCAEVGPKKATGFMCQRCLGM